MRRRLGGGSGRVGGRVGQAPHGGHAGRIPGVWSVPALAVQEPELVVHGALAHGLLVLRGQVPEHAVDGGDLKMWEERKRISIYSLFLHCDILEREK